MESGRKFTSLLIREHCLAKNELNSSAFFLNSVTSSFSCNKEGIMGTFLLFKKVFNMDQYGFSPIGH